MDESLESWIERGARISLDELRTYGSRFDVADGYNRSYQRLLGFTSGSVDPLNVAHAVALLVWLRAWGCRHLRRADTDEVTIPAVQTWADEWLPRLPDPAAALTDLNENNLHSIAAAFGALAERTGAGRTFKGSEYPVRFGPTAAAKALFAIRPLACPPWDEPIRLAFRYPSSSEGYSHYLRLVRDRLESLGREARVPVTELPALLGRPTSSPPKLIDEYLWSRISRGL